MESYDSLIVAIGIVVVAIIILVKTAVVVPQQNAYVVERLGKYAKTLNAGFHILIPFIEKVAYKHTLKEQAADIAEQVCITKDNAPIGRFASPQEIAHFFVFLCSDKASYSVGSTYYLDGGWLNVIT